MTKQETPFTCPVCNGNGLVPIGFYTHLQDSNNLYAASSSITEKCKSCNGTGIIWSFKLEPTKKVMPLLEGKEKINIKKNAPLNKTSPPPPPPNRILKEGELPTPPSLMIKEEMLLKILQKNTDIINSEYILNLLLPEGLEPMLCSDGEEVEWENSRIELLTSTEIHIIGGGDWQSGVRVKFNITEEGLVYDSWEALPKNYQDPKK